MNTQDLQGNPLTPASDAALAAYATALRQFQCWQGDPLATLAAATEAEPGFAMGHLMQAWLLLLATEPGAMADARALLARAEPLAGTWREQAHAAAARAFAAGQWRQAGRILEDLAIVHPRDALALQAGHLVDFLTGDARMLRDRVARALPAWSPGEPGTHALLGMHAFGLEECGDFAQAEALGRRALELEPADAWAHHAVAHVLEMQGRSREGIDFVRARAPHWQDGFFAVHNAWHGALFHLDQGEPEAALALYDGPVRGAASPLMVDLVDASGLLWRLQLLGGGMDLRTRWQALATAWRAALGAEGAGCHAFNDWHAALAALGAGDTALLQTLLQAAAGAAHADTDLGTMARDVGRPLLAALLELAEGRPRAALPRLRDARAAAPRFGGSHAQRDLIDLTLLHAALQGGELPLARALVHERLALKPHSAVNRLLERRCAARPAGAGVTAAQPVAEISV